MGKVPRMIRRRKRTIYDSGHNENVSMPMAEVPEEVIVEARALERALPCTLTEESGTLEVEARRLSTHKTMNDNDEYWW